MSERGPWILSASGRRLHLLNLRPDDIYIEDIAAALSKVCRFGGHCREFYSVAQHSVLVSNRLPLDRGLALQGLLHDATEAYVGDMVRPLKHVAEMLFFRQVEEDVWGAVAKRFELPPMLSPDVKLADNRMLQTERRDLLQPHPWQWTADLEALQPYDDVVVPVPSWKAEEMFLRSYKELS